MPIPSQTFTNIQQLITYINTYIIPNGNFEIDGEEANNALNALANFIPEYAINAGNGGDIHNTGGVYPLVKPVTVFSSVVPTSVSFPGNIQNEYYIVNATGFNIPIATPYLDQYGTSQIQIPARTSIHIGRLQNGSWVLLNNLGGGGGGGSLPPQAGKEGMGLVTNGASAYWQPVMPIRLYMSDFEPDGITCLSPKLNGLNRYFMYIRNANLFITQDEDSPPDFIYVTNGFQLMMPWFNPAADAWKFIVYPQPSV